MLENHREILAASRAAENLRLTSAPANGRDLVIFDDYFFDLLPRNAMAFDADVSVIALGVVL